MLSRELATIVVDVDDPLEAFSCSEGGGLCWQSPDVAHVQEVFNEMQLDSIAQERYMSLLQHLAPE